jgi:hypothetical protein
MEDITYAKQFHDYQPIGKRGRRPEGPLRRPPDGNNREAETGHLLGYLHE